MGHQDKCGHGGPIPLRIECFASARPSAVADGVAVASAADGEDVPIAFVVDDKKPTTLSWCGTESGRAHVRASELAGVQAGVQTCACA